MTSFTVIDPIPDHEESEGDALRAVLEEGGRVVLLLLRLDRSVVQHRRQEVHLHRLFDSSLFV